MMTSQVSYRAATRPVGRANTVTDMVILENGNPVAKNTVLGKYTQVQALKEFKLNRKRFTFIV